jgi:hypothetical protein
VARNGEIQHRETQPDHPTKKPWALFAFVWNAQTRSLADQVLHAATTQNPNGLAGLPLVLLTDALYCSQLFL